MATLSDALLNQLWGGGMLPAQGGSVLQHLGIAYHKMWHSKWPGLERCPRRTGASHRNMAKDGGCFKRKSAL